MARLPEGVDEGSLLSAALARGVKMTGLSHTYHDPETADRGLILGYGNVTPSEIDQGVRLVAEALARLD
jgi:GntR family transcriptional regulator/MocR family aminotransferase